MEEENNIMVSVLMITYNHEAFISEAIEGVLMQKCKFPIELIIGEDCSNDKTAQICQEFALKYPEIKLLPSESNLGMIPNFIRTLKECKGKYIALCEGDDYWTDPYKLNKQVDFMEANEDFAISFHNMKIIYDDGRETHLSNPTDQKEVTTIEDLAQGNYIYTASCVFRNGLIKEFPNWFKDSPVGDYVLHMLNAQHGKIKYLKDNMGVYRIHKGGLWGNTNYETMLSKWIKMQDNLIGMFDSRINSIIIKSQLNNIIIYFQLIKKSGSKNMFEDYFPKSFASLPQLIVDYIEEIDKLKAIVSDYENSNSYKIRKSLIKPFKYFLR